MDRSAAWSRRWSRVSAYALRTVALDAIPDISDPQIIVYAKWPRSPLLIETEVTEPVIRALQGSPDIRSIRGTSHMGYSFIYVILQDPGRRATVRQFVAGPPERDPRAAAARRQRHRRSQRQQHGLDLPVRARRSREDPRPARAAAAEREPDQAGAAVGAGRRRGRLGRRAREAVSGEAVSAAAERARHLAQAGPDAPCRAPSRRPAAAPSRSPTASISCAGRSTPASLDKLEFLVLGRDRAGEAVQSEGRRLPAVGLRPPPRDRRSRWHRRGRRRHRHHGAGPQRAGGDQRAAREARAAEADAARRASSWSRPTIARR